MDVFQAIQARRSIRRFRPDPVAPELITRCLEAARLAPSGSNAQPWKLIVVRDAERRAGLMRAAHGQAMIGAAPVVIVLAGDHKVYRKRIRRGQELVDIGAVDAAVVERVAAVYRDTPSGKEQNMPAILANCMLAGQHLVLEAVNQGLGTCWVMLFKRADVAALLGLPEHCFPVALIPIGYADEDPLPRPRYPLADVAFDETLDRPWAG